MDILKAHAEHFFISGTDKRLFPYPVTYFDKTGRYFHLFSFCKILAEMEVIEEVEGMTVFSDRDTDIKHKLIRHFLRKIPAPLSLTE